MSLLNEHKINLDNVEDDIQKSLKNVENKLERFEEKFEEKKSNHQKAINPENKFNSIGQRKYFDSNFFMGV